MKIALLALLAACTTGTSYDSTESAIVGGARSTGMISTVMVVAYPTNLSTYYTCSGVVIAPTAVLTAAHCVDHPGYKFGIFTGDDATPYAASASALAAHLEPVSETHIAPGYSTTSPFYGDIAIANTTAPLAVAPAQIQLDPLGDISGATATILGYGQTVSGTNNYARYTATTVVGATEDDTIVIGDDTTHGCLGDSGGPAFLDGGLEFGGTVIGIDSYGPPGCTGASHYRRPNAFASFIRTYAGPPPVLSDDYFPDTDASVAGHDTGGGGCCDAGSGPGGATIGTLGVAHALVRRRRATSSRA
jgi:V8-like Glu-specific endopeptidase